MIDLLGLFIGYPWLAAVIGLLFGIVGWQRRRRGVVTVGVIWILYAAYETAMHRRWLCTGECNIRVDLLLIYPVLLLISLSAALSLWRTRHAERASRR